MVNIKSASPSMALCNLLDENILKNAFIHDFYYCEQFGTFPFPTNVQPNYFCTSSCYNCCKISTKKVNQSYECQNGCVSEQKIKWSSCI